LGFGDQAAAVASWARRPKGSFAESAADLTASKAAVACASIGPPPIRADMQHGLII